MFSLVLALFGCSLATEAPDEPVLVDAPVPTAPVHEAEILSKPYKVDKKYMSMTGPSGFDSVTLGDTLADHEHEELLWITGYHTEVLKAEKGKDDFEPSPEFMCHANLDFDAAEYYKVMEANVPLSGRVFTLSQGQQEIEFPKGMGIPVSSKLPLTLATQVLNLNYDDINMKVQHRVKVRFVRDSELDVPMIPLYQGAVEGFKALEDAYYYGIDQSEADPDEHGQGCSVGQAAIAGDVDEDRLGQKFTAHWIVPPGREVNRTNVTRFLNLPFDTTAHYIAVHMHPFGESLELIDLTTGESVYKAEVRNRGDKVGIESIDYYSAREGIKLYKNHEYELVSVYNNTTDENVDSMAVMYLYMLDKKFEKPPFVSH